MTKRSEDGVANDPILGSLLSSPIAFKRYGLCRLRVIATKFIMKMSPSWLFLFVFGWTTSAYALSPKQYASVDHVFDTSGYIVLGEFIDEYEIEDVHHHIDRPRGTEYIKRSYVGRIKVEALLPGYKNLDHEKTGYEYIDVLFAKADVEQLKATEIFAVSDGRRSGVRPISKENPHYQEYRDILQSGAYYLRPYQPFIGTWVCDTESGVSGFLTLEQLGWGSWGAKGHAIRWRAYKDKIRVYLTDEDSVDLKIVEPETGPTKLMLNEVQYRMALSGERFNGLFERMLKQQQLVNPAGEHPALGVWAFTRKLASEVKPYGYLSLNPDTSVYMFNSDKDLTKGGSWKVISGEEQFYLRIGGRHGDLVKVVKNSEGEYLDGTYLRARKLTPDELNELTVPGMGW